MNQYHPIPTMVPFIKQKTIVFKKSKKIEGFAVFTVEPSFQGTDDCPLRHLYGTSHYTGWGEGQGKRRKVNYKTVFLGKWR